MKYLYCYDLEIYPNCFLCCVADLVKRKISVFEVSTRKDQRKEMFDYLREAYRNKGWFIGFNNVGFDSPLLHHFLKNQIIYEKILKSYSFFKEYPRDVTFWN